MSNLFPSFSLADDESAKELNKVHNEPLFKTIEYELSDIVNKVSNIDNLDEAEIKRIIINQHDMILNYDLFLMCNDTRKQAQMLFKNEKFLKCFLDVIRLIKLSNHEIICLNKLAYDYYINEYENDPKIYDLLYQLTAIVNGKSIIVLSGIIGIFYAKVLAMIRNSTFDTEKAVHRVNTFIVKSPIDISVSGIISIYCELFERFSNVFTFTMLENDKDINSEFERKKYDNISIALLQMLDSLTEVDIRRVLYNYGYIINISKHVDFRNVRFAIKTAYRYTRILNVRSSLEISDNLIIP